MKLTASDVCDIFTRSGALLDGHFQLTSGKHSRQYLEKFRVYEHPRLTERLCEGIVERITEPVDVVVGPALGGIFLAYEVARQMDIRALYAERDEGHSGRTFRRGVTPKPGDRVLVVDDVLSTGGSLRETLDAVGRTGADVVSAFVLVDRSGGEPGVTALWTIKLEVFDPQACPLCAQEIPAVKPGTSPLRASAHSG